MLSIINRLRTEPAAFYVTLAGTIAALIVALGHLKADDAAILAGLVTAIGSAVTALETRPVNIAVVAGAAGVILQSCVLFGFHPSADLSAAVVQAVALVLGLLAVRPNVTPVVTLRAEQGAHVRAVQ
jgi:hypothetical protein